MMDGLQALFKVLKDSDYAKGNLLGLLNVLIGRQISDASGHVISTGLTWRELAEALKKARWDRETVRELGLDPADLPPRQRDRFWYAAVAQAQVGSDKATLAGDRLAKVLQSLGYQLGPAPGR
jgi:hypothetical protein